MLKEVLKNAKDFVKDCPDHKVHEYLFSFGDNSGVLNYIVIAWQWAKDRQTLKHYMLCGDATFTLVPSKTIITETRSHSYMFGLFQDYDTQTTVYDNPITVESLNKVKAFIYQMQIKEGKEFYSIT